MHFDIGSIIGLAATLIGGWVGTRIIRPRDHQRAIVLDAIAKGAAALVLGLNPGAKWADLLKLSVSAISVAAGLPTTNRDAIERAAAAALAALGKQPDA